MLFERFNRNQRIFDTIERLHFRPWHWLALAAVMVLVDYHVGPTIHFPVLFILPIVLAAWFSGRTAALVLSVVLPTARLFYGSFAWEDWFSGHAVINVLIRISVFSLLALLTAFAADVRVLRGMLAICGHCKKIRDAQGSWLTLEGYMERHSEAIFSHGICPDCLQHHYPDVRAGGAVGSPSASDGR